MKKQPNSKMRIGLMILVSSIVVGQTALASTQKLVINNSTAINLKDDITYDFSQIPRQIIVESADPIICHSLYQANNNLTTTIFDSNDSTPSGLQPTVLESFYDLQQGSFVINTDTSMQCANADGLIYSEQQGTAAGPDVIFRSGVDVLGGVDIEVTITPAAISSISDNQTLNYQINVFNNGSGEAVVDVIDFFDNQNSGTPYLTSGSWTCLHSSGNNANCGSNQTSQGTVFLDNAILGGGQGLTLQISRDANAPFTQGQNEYINLLAAAFVQFEDTQNNTIKDLDLNNNTASVELLVTDNIPPTITKILDQGIMEGGQLLNVGFIVDDVDSLGVLNVTAVSSNQNVVSNSNITINGTGPNRTLSITGLTDQNTSDDPIEITVQVIDDAGGLDSETFSLEIEPINDPPTFGFQTTNVQHPVGTSGLQGPMKNFLTNLVLGPTDDEIQLQQILDIDVQVSGDNIFASIGGSQPTIQSSGTLTYILSGQSGTANVAVTIQDDGGTANGGIDTSATMMFDITVAAGNPGVQLTKGVYLGHNNGGSCASASSFVSVNSGDDVTFCYTLTNNGDTYLDSINITDDFGLDPIDPNINVAQLSDLTEIGNTSFPLQPAGQVVWYYEVTVGNDELQSRGEAMANPVTEFGVDLLGLNDVTDLSNDVLVNL
ncbi:hypothetical protein [Marinicella sp. W31]|uniref:hypothetical protein n=1 Tax=Marinicella sp. W31 TaxID=3023713 RepID=UPI00375692D1